MKEKRYITTSLPYVNDVPHIGFALEAIQADAWARYNRLKGRSVYFLTGVDEHGTKIEKKAKEQEKTPKQFVDVYSKAFRDLKKTLNLSWDGFIRTTDKTKHWPGVIKIWKELEKSGDIYKRTYQGLYCSGCEAFVSDKDLEGGLCAIHKREPELVEEENYFFRMSAYGKTLKKKIETKELEIIPEFRAREILSLMEKGLEDVSFSRSSKKLTWGVPVPGDDSQTMYVWCDALTNYISAIGYGRDSENFKKWWPADVHVLGKDILRFHAAIWPAMLLSAHLPLPQKLFVHGHINVDGQKMSKSLGNVVAPKPLVDEFGVDAVRYYFLREISPVDDGDFSRVKFIERYNADLAHGLGNLYARVTGLASKAPRPIPNDFKMMDLVIEQKIKALEKTLEEKMEQFRFNEALVDIWGLISYGDYYINDRTPWSKENPPIENEKTLFNLLILLQSIAVFIEPFMPDTSKKIATSISLKGKTVKVKEIKKLFPRIEDITIVPEA